MGIELREVLKRLCVEIGWSYAVYWRAICLPSPKHLVWEDGHWFGKPQFSGRDDASSHVSSLPEFQSLGEGSMHELVHKTMVPRVHVVGVGIVGQAAAAGIHEWILRDVSSDSESVLKHFAELHDQFLAGIQTVVILPVLPYGVVQFGSTKRVMENILFLVQARTSFMQLECKKGHSFNSFEQKVCSQNSLPHASISPAASDYPFRVLEISWKKSLRQSSAAALESGAAALVKKRPALQRRIRGAVAPMCHFVQRTGRCSAAIGRCSAQNIRSLLLIWDPERCSAGVGRCGARIVGLFFCFFFMAEISPMH